VTAYRPRGLRSAKLARVTAVDAPTRPFVPPPCARCKAPLVDADGNPRWDITGQLTFVCLGGCAPVLAGSRRSELT
jgi:hypothetical protein